MPNIAEDYKQAFPKQTIQVRVLERFLTPAQLDQFQRDYITNRKTSGWNKVRGQNLRVLTDSEKQAVKAYFVEKETGTQEIKERYNITQDRVDSLSNTAVRNLAYEHPEILDLL